MAAGTAEENDEVGWLVGQELLTSEGDTWLDGEDDPVWRWLRLTLAAFDSDSRRAAYSRQGTESVHTGGYIRVDEGFGT
jgi:hypothetical protein